VKLLFLKEKSNKKRGGGEKKELKVQFNWGVWGEAFGQKEVNGNGYPCGEISTGKC